MEHIQLRRIWYSQEEKARRKRVKELIRIYNHDWNDILQTEINELFSDQEEAAKLCSRADTSLNILKWATDTLASVYSKRVKRSVNTSGNHDLERVLDDAQYDMALDKADKMLFLCREVFVRPVIKPESGKIVLDIVTPDRVAVLLSPENFREVIAIAVSMGEGAGFEVWTEKEHYLTDRDFQPLVDHDNPEGVNPLGVIPWIPCHASFPLHSFFNERESEGLKRATIQACVSKTDYNHLRHVQSFKQLAFTGTTKEEQKRLKVGPSDALHLQDSGASISVLDMQANLSEHLESLLSSVAATLNLYGIRPEQVKGSLSASSGYALEIQMHETEKVWQQHRQLWRLYEQSIYDVAQMESERYGLMTLPFGELVVEFPPVGPSSNPSDELDFLIKAVQNGLMSKNEAMKRAFGYSEEKILKEMELMKKEASFLSPMGLDVPVFHGFSSSE